MLLIDFIFSEPLDQFRLVFVGFVNDMLKKVNYE